ncbi:MAG TPA: RDD family protein [Terriglobales bacterium]|nr:RDD family protein [Terriglobales bacterium]
MPIEATVFCSQCGQAHAPSEVVMLAGAPVCANCKATYVRKLQEAAPQPLRLVYRGFWIRLLAKILDGILLDFVILPLSFLFAIPAVRSIVANQGKPPDPRMVVQILGAYAIAALSSIVLVTAYNTWMIGRFGTTMGKMAINAKVVTPSGGPVSYKRAFIRSLMELVNAFTLEIGYLIAAFDDQKRGLHDRVAGTVVVAKS